MVVGSAVGSPCVVIVAAIIYRHGDDFRNMANTRAPDTYVKLVLMSSSGQEIAHSKTSVRRGQPNPLFKETFMFQVKKNVLFHGVVARRVIMVFTVTDMKVHDSCFLCCGNRYV